MEEKRPICGTILNWQPLADQVLRNGGVTLEESMRVRSAGGAELVISVIVETPEANEKRLSTQSN